MKCLLKELLENYLIRKADIPAFLTPKASGKAKNPAASRFEPDVRSYQGPHHHRKYGEKINPRQMPEQFLCERYSDKDSQTEIYQAQVRHKEFACRLNIVIIVKTNLKTQAQAHVILFTSDLELSYQKVIDYYSLRFQIEFNFREAAQSRLS